MKLLVLCIVWLGLGCSSIDAERSCNDLADAVADRAAGCGYDRAEARDQFLEGLPGASCTHIDDIRDEKSLHDVCLPAIAAASCDAALAGEFDASCTDQLIGSATTPALELQSQPAAQHD